MKRLTLVALGLLVSTGAAQAQTPATDDSSQQTIVYPDGSDPLLVDTTANPAFPDPAAATPTYVPLGSAARSLTADEEKAAQQYAARQHAMLKDEVKSLTKAAKDVRKREGKLTQRVTELRNSRKIADRSQIEIVNQKLQVTREEVARTEDALARSTRQRDALGATLNLTQAERERELAQVGLGHLARERGTRLPSRADVPSEVSSSDPGAGASAATGIESPEFEATPTTTPEAVATTPTSGKEQRKTPYAVYAMQEDPRYSPPVPDCVREAAGVDEFTQQRRVRLAPELLFAFTTPELRAYLGNESLISCYARLVRLGPTIILDAEFVIRSQFASKEFGVLAKGSQLTLRMVGGEKLVLRNNVQSQAQYDPVTKISTYRGTYPISKGQAKFLKDAKLDQVRIMWGTGFDDYAIYDLTLLQRQLDCL